MDQYLIFNEVWIVLNLIEFEQENTSCKILCFCSGCGKSGINNWWKL